MSKMKHVRGVIGYCGMIEKHIDRFEPEIPQLADIRPKLREIEAICAEIHQILFDQWNDQYGSKNLQTYMITKASVERAEAVDMKRMKLEKVPID